MPYRDDRQLFGVTPEQLGRIQHSICLAGSASKAQAAIGAARAGLYNVLVTDATTARAMNAYLDGEDAQPTERTGPRPTHRHVPGAPTP